MRERIEKGIRKDKSLKEIAKAIDKDLKLNIKYIKPGDLIIKNIHMIKYELKKSK